MFRRKYFIITVKGGKSQYSANKKKKSFTFRLKYNEVVWGVKILQVKQRYSRNRLSSLGLHRGQVLPPERLVLFCKALLFGMLFFRALTISVTRAACCTMTLKTNVFKWAGHWHEGGSNVFKSFLSTPKGFTWHNAFVRQKKVLVWRKTSQTRFSSLSDKHRCHGFHGFDRKVVSLIWIAVVVMHCCSWAHIFLDPDRHLLPVTEVVCFRTIHITVRYSSPLLWASSLVRQESILHSTSSQSQTWERERVTKRVGSFVE